MSFLINFNLISTDQEQTKKKKQGQWNQLVAKSCKHLQVFSSIYTKKLDYLPLMVAKKFTFS